MLNRRQLTIGAGAGILLAPFISMLKESSTRAATTKQAKRLLVFCTMGTKPDSWTPTVSGETISAWSAMTQPLSAIKDNVLLVEGCPGGSPEEGHGSPQGITGQGNGYYAVNNVPQLKISIDQFVADKLIKAGVKRPLASLVLGADTAASGSVTMSFRAGNPVTPISSPASAFSTAFGGVSTGGGTMTGTGGGTMTVDAALKRRQSILNLVKGEITDVQKRLGAAEKAKLDAHLTSIRSLEDKLSLSSSGSTGGGSNPNAGQACAGLSKPTDSAKPIENALLHLDILVNALACDITRVGVIQFGSDQALQVDLPDLKGDQHNGFIHSGANEKVPFQNLIAFEAWLATQFANVVTQLKSKPDPDGGGGTLYDSTLVVWARDMGDAVNHNMKDMRFVLAGGAGGYLKQAPGGRYLNPGGGAANRHERVLLSVMEAMGVTDYTGFGDPGFSGKSPLPGIAAT